LNTKDLRALSELHSAHNYHPLPIVIAEAEGAWVTDVEGRRYLDMLAAYSAVNFGHRHPRLVEAAKRQLHQVTLVSRAFDHDQFGPFVTELAELVGKDMVLPMNSGAEAVETALKTARKWGYEVKGVPAEQANIITFEGNFHGRTTTIVSFSTDPDARNSYGPFTPGFRTVPYGDVEALRAAVDENTVGVLVEPIQGEAGIRVPPDGYLEAVRELTTRAGVLMIVDEIQSGMGRTGRFFGHQHAGIRPDVVTMAKALGSGFPIGATIAVDEVANAMRPGDHGTTFGGNPVACAAALATLDVIEPLLEGHVDTVSRRLEGGLRQLRDRMDSPGAALRGTGLWFGLDLGPNPPAGAKDVARAALSRGLVVNPVTDTVLRLAPPLVIEEDDVDEGLLRLGGALEEVGVCR
jgi:ornithine--oxo-acid transaminase